MSVPQRLQRASIALFILILFAACVSIAGDHSESRGEQRVGVTIDSRPDSGEVYVDGAFVGTAPLVQRLTPGVHTIEVTREGWSTWKRELTVKPDNPTNVTALLRQQQRPS